MITITKKTFLSLSMIALFAFMAFSAASAVYAGGDPGSGGGCGANGCGGVTVPFNWGSGGPYVDNCSVAMFALGPAAYGCQSDPTGMCSYQLQLQLASMGCAPYPTTPPPTPSPVCTLTAPSAPITAGNPATLSWTSYYGVSISIDHGVGAVSPVEGGSVSVSPTATTTYTATVTGQPTNPTFTYTPGPAYQYEPVATDALQHGGIASWNTVRADMPSADRLCNLTQSPSHAQTITQTGNFNSPSNNTVIGWNGSSWYLTKASAFNSYIESITCVSDTPHAGPTAQCSATVTVKPPTDVCPNIAGNQATIPSGYQLVSGQCVLIPPANGCIKVTKETYNTNGQPFTPVPQFSFTLDGATTTQNDASGNATFANVTPGTHTVTEVSAGPAWNLYAVTPANGQVVVGSGPTCASVNFKNKQVVNPPHACKLEITKSVNHTSAVPGDTLTYTINFKNSGDADCTGGGVEIIDQVATGLAYKTGSETHTSNVTAGYGSDPVYKASDHTLRWNGNVLTPGETGSVTWKAIVNTPSACTATVPNTAKISSAEYDNFDTWVPSNTVSVNVTKDCTPVVKGCIQVTKETYDTNSQPFTPVPQFSFKLDGATTTQNDSDGNAIFTDVEPGTHTVSEVSAGPAWNLYAVTPANGQVVVGSGPTCASVNFKNKQVPPAPDSFTVKATKIVCDHESDLPNWGGGGPNISSTTASDFLAAHANCHAAPDWTFEWGNGGLSNPGDEDGAGGTGWMPFGPTNASGIATAVINSFTGGKIWVREQFKSGYIPFTGVGIVSNVSAEMYCSTDVLNYDNFDFIDSPVANHTYYCVAWNVPVTPNAPTCALDASPDSFTAPGTTTLSWVTHNATSISIDHTIGAVTPVSSGSTTTPVSVDTTYTATVHGPGGDATCTKTVTVTPPPGPSCNLSVSSSHIETGDHIKVSWTSSNATTGSIDQNVGNASPVSSGTSDDIYPPSDTTYTGTFGDGTSTTTCHVLVTVHTGGGGCQGGCGGGGYNPPNTVLYQKPGDAPLAAFVYLSQVPYTGFEAGPALTAIFWTAVALFAAILAYFMMGQGGVRYLLAYVSDLTMPAAREVEERSTEEERKEEREKIYGVSYPTLESGDRSGTQYAASVVMAAPVIAPVIAPVMPLPVKKPSLAEAGIPPIADVIESRAHAAGVLISPEAVSWAAQLSNDRAEALVRFGDILNRTIQTIPREDGWVMLTSDRFEGVRDSLGFTQKMVAPNVEPIAPRTLPNMTATESAASEFAGAIISGDRDTAFGIIRSMEKDHISPIALITATALEFDKRYRADLSDTRLHRLVEVFAHAVDGSYSNPFTGVKLALAQAFETVA